MKAGKLDLPQIFFSGEVWWDARAVEPRKNFRKFKRGKWAALSRIMRKSG